MKKLLTFIAAPVATLVVMLASAFYLPDWGIYVALSIPLVLVVLFVGIPGFTVPADYLARWSKAHGVAITDENRSIVRRYLLHGRRIRSAGALAGLAGHATYTIVTHQSLPFGWITATFGGYLLGAATAEIWTLRPQPGRVRAASLAPRKITDYLPGFGVVGLRVLPVLTVLAAATWPLVRERELSGPDVVVRRSGPGIDADVAAVIGWTIASVVLAIFIEATSRRIVRRPQPLVSEEFVDVDDAVRSTSLHGLFGAGLALLLGALARNLGAFQSAPLQPDWVQSVFFAVMVIAGVASPFAWLYFGIDQPWVVRRSRQPQVAV